VVAAIVAVLSVLAAQSPELRATPPVPPPPPPATTRPALTLRQLVGQRMVFAYDGLTPPPQLRSRIRRGEAAGVIVFARNVRSATQLRATVRDLQAIPRPRAGRAVEGSPADRQPSRAAVPRTGRCGRTRSRRRPRRA